MTTVDEVEAYPFAGPDNFDTIRFVAHLEAHQQFAVCGGINSAIFHNYLGMCGQEDALYFLKTDPELAKAMIRRITDYWEGYLRKLLAPGGGMIHTNRGTQFCSNGYRKGIKENQFTHCMSRQGNCWDNAVAEPFFRTLKTEWAYHIRLRDLEHAKHELFRYVEVFYNNQRLHQTLNYRSPAAFERLRN